MKEYYGYKGNDINFSNRQQLTHYIHTASFHPLFELISNHYMDHIKKPKVIAMLHNQLNIRLRKEYRLYQFLLAKLPRNAKDAELERLADEIHHLDWVMLRNPATTYHIIEEIWERSGNDYFSKIISHPKISIGLLDNIIVRTRTSYDSLQQKKWIMNLIYNNPNYVVHLARKAKLDPILPIDWLKEILSPDIEKIIAEWNIAA